MTIRCCPLRWSLAAALIGTTGLASASPRPGSRAASEAAQRDPLQQGRSALAARRWADAEANFTAVLAAPEAASMTPVQRAEVVGRLGLSELGQHKYRAAAEHLAKSLEQATALRQPLLGTLTQALGKAVEHVGRVYVAVGPPDASLLVDGRAIGTGASAYVLFLDPGTHTLRAQLAGHDDAHYLIDVAAGEKQFATMVLSRVTVLAREPAKVAITHPRRLGSLPVRPPARSVWASWPGTLRVTGIGLTTATATFGALFMVRAAVLNGDLDERTDGLRRELGGMGSACRRPAPAGGCAELAELHASRDRFAALGTGMVVAAGVVGAVTAASFFMDFSFSRRPEGRSERVAVVPLATPQQVGLTVQGVW